MLYILPMIFFLFMVVAIGIAVWQRGKRKEELPKTDIYIQGHYHENSHMGP